MKTPRSVIALWATLITGWTHAASPDCKLHELHPVGANVDIGTLHLDLGHPDKADMPTAWEGPIVIKRQGHAPCTVADHVAIVSLPLALGNERYLYVPTYSGSESIFYVVDTQDCSERWQSPPYAGDVVFKKNDVFLHEAGHIHIGPRCLPD